MAGKLARRVVFLGPPGSGKGSYGKICARLMGVPHLSTGDMLRAEVEAGTAVGREAASRLAAGDMVDDELLGDVLSGVLAPGGSGAGAAGFLLDGFPRSVAQAHMLDELLQSGSSSSSSSCGAGGAGTENSAAIERVVHITMDEDILVAKLGGRRQCGACGGSYNVADVDVERGGARILMPPVLPPAGGACAGCADVANLTQREDDEVGVIANRLALYQAEVGGIVEHYRRQRVLRDVHIVGGYDVMTHTFEQAVHLVGAVDGGRG